MNILYYLTPKSTVVCLNSGMTLRQAMETMEYHRYQSMPIVDDDGLYCGVLTEGDILWFMKKKMMTFKDTENVDLKKVPKYWSYRSVTITESIDGLLGVCNTQRFVPVVDDANVFIGIVKRSAIIEYFYKKNLELTELKKKQ